MAFSGGDSRDHGIAEINIIPLCDVLLVLLIIFMVTAPALSHQIELALPQPAPIEQVEPPPPIRLQIDASGGAWWNGEAVDRETLKARMHAEAKAPAQEQPMLEIDASGDCDYQSVARVVAMAKNVRLARIGFVARPG
jgi:biopolymer transport protein ExbD